MSEYILEIKNIRKEFPGVVALDDVSLNLKRGEIHALVGENGAGKSTLMKILAGIYIKDKGEILFDGEPFEAKHPMDALLKGISMVHQELDLVPDMTVEENVFCGRENTKGLFIDKKGMLDKTRQVFEELGIDIDPKTRIRQLSTAQQQMVAIARAMAFGADVIIMDEPTSAITDREIEKLFEVIRKLRDQQKAIVYISHKMDEIYSLTDRITVFRDGRLIGCVETKDVTPESLINMMVGRKLENVYIKTAEYADDFNRNEVVLDVQNLSRAGEFENISFQVKRGEILGIFGLMGAGRTEVMDTIFGVRKADSGKVTMLGKPVSSIGQAIKSGMAYVTEDRKLSGLNLIGSIKDNITIAYLGGLCKMNCFVDFAKERKTADELIKKLTVKCPGRDTLVGSLSGGNQQKVVLAKWFLGNPELIIMDEPTRGIDIGAKSEIYRLMDQLAKSGKSIIMISSETPELMGMSDRVLIMHEGVKTGELDAAEFDQDLLMTYAIGAKKMA